MSPVVVCFNMEANSKRTKTALVTLAVGLALNIALGAAKLVTGVLADSTAVTSDALNNLSDAAVSVVTIIATALAARAADHEHPFGHGRYEYIATFILGAVIVVVGVEVFSSGLKRAIDPVEPDMDVAVWATLAAAIAVKACMAVFYRIYGVRIGSDAIKAAAVDSLSDCAVTSVVLLCAVTEKFTGVHIDGYASMAVAAVIIFFAVRILKSTVSRLLGERPDPLLYAAVNEILTSDERVLSVHDLIINDYGAAKKIAEADAVFPADMSFTDVHAVCDALERKVAEQTGVRLCIHADPLIVADERLALIRSRIDAALCAFGATAHDVTIGDERRKVTFDIKLPDGKAPQAEIKAQAEAQARSVLPYDVEVDMDYI